MQIMTVTGRDNTRLEELKRKNADRLRRVDAALILSRMAPLVATLCNRFSISVDAARARELSRFANRFQQAGDWYLKGESYGMPHDIETRDTLARLIGTHGLSGWVEFNVRSPNNDAAITLGTETANLPDLIPALLDMHAQHDVPYGETPQLDDCWLINREAEWGLLLWHEGRIVFERSAEGAEQDKTLRE